jgi:hypothetical protein
MAGFTPLIYHSTPSATDIGFTGAQGSRSGAYSDADKGWNNTPPPPTPGIFGAGQ